MNDSPTRTGLLDATRRVVQEHGLAGATSRRITTEAGANLAAITYHFGSKDQLVADALFGELEARVAPVLALLEQDVPAVERLVVAVQGLVGEFEASRDTVPVYLEALALAAGDGPFAERGRTMVVALRARLAEVVRDLRDEGTVADWVDPEAMASLLIAAANGLALQSRLDPDGPGVPALAAQFAGLLLAARGDLRP